MISLASACEIPNAPHLSFSRGIDGPEKGVARLESADRSETRVFKSGGQTPSGPRSAIAIGEMVWGKVRSHPWWPGQIFNPAFATPSVRADCSDPRHVLVAFFGDGSYGWLDPSNLIPFAPHFSDKSRQTTLSPFLDAVEEATDEAARRAALALVCPCRAPHSSFRPTVVPGFLAVDVPGYEPGGIYSISQIKKTRKGFNPQNMLSFLQRVAVTPITLRKGIDQIRGVAMLLMYRKAVFEEHDETYVEAFALGVDEDEPEEVTTQALPDILPAVVKNSGDGQNDIKLTIEEPLSIGTPNISHQEQLPSLTSEAQITVIVLPPAPKVGDLVLQKREQLPGLKDVEAGEKLGVEQQKSCATQGSSEAEAQASEGNDSPFTVVCAGNEFKQDSEPASYSEDGMATHIHRTVDAAEPMQGLVRVLSAGLDKPGEKKDVDKKKKLLRLHREGPEPDFNKMKRMKIPGTETVPGRTSLNAVNSTIDREAQGKSAGRSTSIGSGSGSVVPAPSLHSASANRDLPRLCSDMRTLPVDHSPGVKRGAPSTVGRVILKFQSQVNQKSIVLPPASKRDSSELCASKSSQESVRTSTGKEDLKDHQEPSSHTKLIKPREPTSYAKPIKPASKADEQTKSIGQKRSPSGRLEEMAVKRLKKLDKLRTLPTEKKSGVSQRPVEEVQRREQKSTDIALALAKPVKKQEHSQLSSATPTWLIMKFPSKTALPSASSLKAKLARFGPLDLSGTRIFWKTHSCKVLFKYKPDAEVAESYVVKNDLFGPIKVSCHLREFKAPVDEKKQAEANSNDTPLVGDGNGGNAKLSSSPWPSPELQHQHPVPLKSCLKKPGGGGSPPGSAVSKECSRVKFLLGEDDAKTIPRAMSHNHNNGGANASMMTTLTPLATNNSVPKSVSFHQSPPPTQPSLLPLSHEPRDVHRLRPPPPQLRDPRIGPPRVASRSPPEGHGPAQHMLAGHSEVAKATGNSVDISHQMLSLMVRCSEIVSNIKSSVGYVAYSPL